MVLRKGGYTALLVGMTLALGACSAKNDDSASDGTTTNEFSSLPEVTGPVTSASSSASRALAALTGVVLESPGTFGAGKSLQMCENVNYVKEILREAASPDKILCYMSAMRSSGVIPRSANLANGSVKYMKLVNLPDGGGGGNTEPAIKVQITKSGGAIASFKMWSCFNGTSSAPEQSEYISQSFSGGQATVTSKYLGSMTDSGNTQSFGSSMTATGEFSGGSWQSKNINGFRYFGSTGTSGTFGNVMTLDLNQYSDRLDMSIAMKGKWGSDAFTNKFYTVAQILDSDKLSTFAIGDGSSKYSMSYDQGDNGSVEHSGASTVSWNGDDKSNLGTATSGDYYTPANAGTVPADPNTSATVSFSGTEAWDCSLPAGESWVEADFSNGGTAIMTGMQACEEKFLGNNDWLQCPY